MKYAVVATAVIATTTFAISPAYSKTMMCSGDHLSKMTTMMGGMTDGPHKWEMYKHLEMVNIAMAKDGMRGCEKIMMNMHRHHHTHHTRHMGRGKKM